MNQHHHTRGVLAVLLLASLARAQDAVILADFEQPGDVAVRVLKQELAGDAAPQGGKYLRLLSPDDKPSRGAAVFSLPKDLAVGEHLSLRAQVRLPLDNEKRTLRWMALDERDRILFQRPVKIDGGGAWHKLDEPLVQFRWSNVRVGDWSQVRKIAIAPDEPARRLDLDDIRLVRTGEPGTAYSQWLLETAFEDRPKLAHEGAGVLVAAEEATLQRFEMRRLLADLQRSRDLVRRVLRLQPGKQQQTAALLIFKDPAGQAAFIKRLGEQWSAAIDPPRVAGFTVQAIATAVYDPKQGADRPVFLHEGLHAVLSVEAGLTLNHAPHTWLHEGLASFCQASVYPRALDRGMLVALYARDIDEKAAGAPRPLKALMSRRVALEEYSQLAVLVAYLISKEPDLLPSLAAGMRDGLDAPTALKQQLLDIDKLQAGYHAWARQTYAPATADQPAFPALPEWAPSPATRP